VGECPWPMFRFKGISSREIWNAATANLDHCKICVQLCAFL
jgi:hypothetical protein